MQILKQNRQSLRLKNYNYENNGFYFVTICCFNKTNYLGNIKNDILEKSKIGEIIDKYLLQISTKFDFAILDKYVIMPNHVHMIIIINNTKKSRKNLFTSFQKGGVTGNYNPMSNNSLGRIIRWFKGRKSFEIHKNLLKNFQWQRNYYDHIIRNKKSLVKIRNYINYNPKIWFRDRNNKLKK